MQSWLFEKFCALAYDQDLDGGAGGLWVQSFGTSLITTRMDGSLIDDFGNASSTSLYGLALADGRLFGHHTGGDVVEIDRTNGTLIGTLFSTAGAFNVPIPPMAQGGLTEVPGGSFGSGHIWDLAAVGQATPDAFAAFELVVPAPGAFALLGLGGLLMARRRR